jgi:hypothetical protein
LRPICFIDEVDKPTHTQKKEQYPMITKLEDLPDTDHNRRYGSEIVRKSLSNPRNQWKLQLNWILENKDWIPFTATVTFKNLKAYEANDGFRKATEYEYEKRVLNKVKKRLCRSSSKWNHVLPIDYHFQYELEQGSHFKPVPRSNSLHHIHGLFPVQKDAASRIYNFDSKEMDSRLVKDLESMNLVSTFLIEPLRTEEANAWFAYMLKGKSRSEIAH